MFAGSALEFYLAVEVEVAVEAVILCSKWLCNVNVMDGVMTANFYSLFHNTHLTAAASLADTNIFL